ncbi:MAG: TetR/AcrR family transcriptional regulator [Hydrogenophilales bacterium]|nr:TetR/AcrR family transcriptional regulator [Hydrogenophilales bacterium]
MASKGEKTRADIVECARRLFYEHGYDGTSFTRIVEASGLFRGNIYHYFKTKDEILLAVVERYLDDYRALLARWEAEHDTPRARLRAFVDMITGHKMELVEYGCPIGSLNTELGKDRRVLQHTARVLFDLFRDWLTARFVELGHKRQAEALALHLLGRAQGVAVIAHVYQDRKLLVREAQQLKAWIDGL